MLDDAGFQVVEAADGREALAVASMLTGPPAILVTDVLMPGMSGPELAAELTAAHPGLPVLYLSGYVDDERREQLLGTRRRAASWPSRSDRASWSRRSTASSTRPPI